MDCSFVPLDSGFVCEKCGRKARKSTTKANCSFGVEKPSVVTQVSNFLPALANHVLSGSPKCTQEEIEGRLAICRECPLFVANTCLHNSCGCTISDKQTFFNKLAWADQKCPLSKWIAISPSGNPG